MVAGSTPVLRGLLAMARRYNAVPIVAGALERLGIPGIRFTDGPRGVVMGASTAFPAAIARGATFDPATEARVADAIGVEARAQGANFWGGVCINLLRHPGWGRAQETYGEDTHLLGEMGAAAVEGAQRHVMACAKHYACNSIERSRFKVDVQVDEADLRDVYLPHFRRCVEAGVASVMTAYNRVNGDWCGHHHHLVTEILKREWGFDGFVMTDFVFGMRNAAAAFRGGQDLEMPFRLLARALPLAVLLGRVPMARIDDAVERALRAQLRFAGRGEPERYRADAIAGLAHRTLAREVAVRSMVLLRNERLGDVPALPLDPAAARLAVVGRLADLASTGDRGSSWVRAPSVVTPLAGLREAVAARGTALADSCTDDPAAAVAAASGADAAIVVVGTTHVDEGEYIATAKGVIGGDRTELRLRESHEALIRAVADACPRTIVVLLGGSAFVTEAWRERVSAILMAWYPGMEGGRAIADVLFGDASPGGRLPMTWPVTTSDLPDFDPSARHVTYGPLHGYRLYEASGRTPAFWFGHGLGYTSFSWSEPSVVAAGDDLVVRVELTNTGSRLGSEVVQVYVAVALGTHREPLRTLCGFRRVDLEPAARATVEVKLDRRLVARAREQGPLQLHAGPCADPGRLRRVSARD